MKNFKKVLSLVLAAAMVFSLAACGEKEITDPTVTPTTAPVVTEKPADKGNDTTPTTAPAVTEGVEPTQEPTVVTPVVTGTDWASLEVENLDGEYVFKDSVSTLASNWNPHTYQTSDDAYPADYLRDGLYTFYFNDELRPVEGKESYEGYVIEAAMAVGDPIDVTVETKASNPEYGIPADADEGYAYLINLNPDAKWEDGTPINADTYVYSMKQLFDPQLKNYRAADYMDSSFSIANAKNYYYQGTEAYNTLGTTTSKYLGDNTDISGLYIDCWNFWGAEGYITAEGAEVPQWVSVLDEVVYSADGAGDDAFSGKELYDTYFAPGAPYESYAADYVAYKVTYEPDFSFDKVGIEKTGEYQIKIVLAKSLAGFNLYYSLTSNWIVYQPYYDACKKQIDGTDAWTTTYNTSVDTTMSYGPYRLTSFQSDKSMTFEKNNNWYGYSDGKHVYQDPEDGLIYPMYQTTKVECQVVAEASTRKLMFLNGQLMSYGLQSEDFAEYRDSEYCYVTPDETIYFFIFNGYMDAIKEREAADDFDQTKFDLETITLQSFRKAVAVTYDKEALCAAVSPQRSGGYGLIGNNYIYDPDTGAKYRDTDQAKQALCDFYSVDVSKFASLDDAVDSITGFDETAAKALYKQAFDEALAQGFITDSDNDGVSDQSIEIIYSSSATSAFITKTLAYLNEKMNEVTQGTPFAGKISFVESAPLGNDWSTKLKAGLTDTVLGGWSGSALDPFGLSDLYTNPSQQYDANWFDSSKVSFTLNVNTSSIKSGKTTMEDVTMTLKQWSDALNGETVTIEGKGYNFGSGIADVETRLDILAKIEYIVLMTYDYIPMLQNASMALLSQQVYYVIEDYNVILGRGGMTYMKYNYDEAAWAAYVAEQGGQLKY